MSERRPSRAADAGAPSTAALDEAEAPPEPTLMQRLTAVQAMRQAASVRLSALEALGASQPLSVQEETEVLALGAQAERLEHLTHELEQAIAKEQVQIDVAAVLEAWGGLMEEKVERYRQLPLAIVELELVFDQIMSVHKRQEALIAWLPAKVRETLSFPDVNTFRQWLAGRFPRDLDGLVQVRGLTHGELQEIMAVDTGLTHLEVERAMRNALERR